MFRQISRKSIQLILCLALALPGLSLAEGDPERGAVLADTCMGCHGVPGYRNAYPSYRVPKLGGQQDEYIVQALQGYKNKTREHPTMYAQGATLSDQDMWDLAAYFAGQGEIQAGETVTGGRAAAGKEKAVVCAACHGESGVSPAANWPSLAGQHQDYLGRAISEYQSGGRKDPVMAGLVSSLSPEDIEDIAAYYAAQSGLFTVQY